MNNVLGLLNKLERSYRPLSISEQFHNNTKLSKPSDPPDSTNWPEEWKTVYFKGYPRLKRISLPNNLSTKINIPFKGVLYGRKSTRNYDQSVVLSKKIISSLLFFAGGVQRMRGDNWNTSRRFYPSPGARYPLEIYPIVVRNTEFENGIYHYHVKTHSLEVLREGHFFPTINTLAATWLKEVNIVFLISAVFGRNQIKYGNRGYRQIFTENGLLTQNFYLVSTALGLGCCALGAYLDDVFNKLIGLDGVNESVIGAIALGVPMKIKKGGDANAKKRTTSRNAFRSKS